MGSTETRRMDSDEFYPLMGDIRSTCDACTLLKLSLYQEERLEIDILL